MTDEIFAEARRWRELLADPRQAVAACAAKAAAYRAGLAYPAPAGDRAGAA